MTRIRTLATAVALALVAAAATAAAGPPAARAADSAQDPVTTVPDLTFTVATGPGGATTCTIDADLYLPSSASPAQRVPAILTTNGFGGSKADQAGLGRAFAERGYAVLSYTGLGFPDSGCKITLDDPAYDGRAASQLISFLGGTGTATKDGAPYAMPDVVVHDATDHAGVAHPDDPRVGMVGGSYGGQIQFATAKVDKRLDAIVPIITWNDLQYSLAPNNTSLDGVTPTVPGTEKIGWTSLFFGVGIADGVQGASIDPTRDVGCPNFRPEACAAKVQLDTFGYPSGDTVALTDQVSVGHYLDDVVIPTFLLQGEKDTLFNLQEAVATYRGLRARGVPVKMVWQSWGHSGSTPAPGELDLTGGDIEGTYLGQRIKDWFDHYLKDSPVGTGPAFAYFRDWVDYSGNARPAYAEAGRYPVASARPLYLSGGGALVASRRSVVPGTTSWSGPGAWPGHQLLGGLGAAGLDGAGRHHAAVRHPGHLRRLDHQPPGRRHRPGRHADPRRPVPLTRGRGDAGCRPGRPAAGVRQALRRRTRRLPDPRQPADQPDPGRRRHPVGAHRAAGHRAPRARGSPAAPGAGRDGRGVQERAGAPAGVGRRRPRRSPGAAAAPRALSAGSR